MGIMFTESVVLLDRYRLDEILLRDGSKILGKGVDLDSGKLVFIKAILIHAAELLAQMEEAGSKQAQRASLVDPRIVPVLDTGVQHRCLIIVLPWIDHPTAAVLVRNDGPICWKTVAKVGIQLLSVVELLQAVDPMIIHGDIKPDNLFIAPDWSILLPDFGIAKQLSSNRDGTTNRFASIFYVEPERLQSLKVTRMSDVWSVIATMFFLVSERAPYAPSSDGLPEFDLLSTLPVDVPRSMALFLAKGLAVLPENRFYSVSEAKNALLRVLHTPEDGVSPEGDVISVEPVDDSVVLTNPLTSIKRIPSVLAVMYAAAALVLGFVAFECELYRRASNAAAMVSNGGSIGEASEMLAQLQENGALPGVVEQLERAIDAARQSLRRE